MSRISSRLLGGDFGGEIASWAPRRGGEGVEGGSGSRRFSCLVGCMVRVNGLARGGGEAGGRLREWCSLVGWVTGGRFEVRDEG